MRQGGALLRSRRKTLGLTIEAVKRSTGLELSDISRLENGRIVSPSLDKVINYAVFLGLTPGEISQAYGLYVLPEGGRISELGHQLQRLPEEERVRLLDMFEALVRAAYRLSTRPRK